MTYSMCAEDLIIEQILDIIGEKSRFCLDLGADDGYRHSNTRHFIDKGWKSLLISANSVNPEVADEWITAENINNLLEKYNAPKDIDFCSIDLDGNDYWVWKAMNYFPRIVCIEYNSTFDGNTRKIMKYDPKYVHQRDSSGYSASAKAMIDLGEKKGYEAIYEVDYNNIIFVLKDEVGEFPRLPRTHWIGDGLDFLPNPHNTYTLNDTEFVEE